MKLEQKLKKLCKDNSEIEVVGFDSSQNTVEVLLPYESSAIFVELEGDTEEECIDNFKESVNHQLDRMIDHLNDCKF